MLFSAGLLFVMAVATTQVSAGESEEAMKLKMTTFDKNFDWRSMKELPNSNVALAIESCKAKVEANENYAFALKEYSEWRKTEEREVAKLSTEAQSKLKLNGCSCDEIIELFDFAFKKGPNVLDSVQSVYGTVCGKGYKRDVNRQKDLINYIASDKIPADLAGTLFVGASDLLRKYIVDLPINDQEWSLDKVGELIQSEKESAKTEIAAVIKNLKLDKKAEGRSDAQKNETVKKILLDMSLIRAILKVNAAISLMTFGMKSADMNDVVTPNEVNILEPSLKISVMNALFQNANATKMASQEKEKFMKIIKNISVILAATTQGATSTHAPANEFANKIFDIAAEKKDWTSDLTEQSVQAICKVSLKYYSENKPEQVHHPMPGSGSTTQASSDGKEHEKAQATGADKSMHKGIGILSGYQDTFKSFDKAALDKYKEDNKEKMLAELQIQTMYLDDVDLAPHFTFRFACV